MKKYDVAAYVWPSYTGDELRARIFWPEGIGEWETVREMKPRFDGHQWPRKPLWGYVNEADPYVMEGQIAAAADHGVNVFIYDWYWYENRPFLEQCLDNGYLKAKNNDRVKFYLMWANHTASTMWDRRNSHLHKTIWDGAVDRKTFDEIIVKRTIEKYFSHPSYYKIDGKPAYMLFDFENFVRGLGGVEEALDALQYFRDETVKAGFPGLSLQAGIRSAKYRATMLDDKTDILTFIHRAKFDGVSIYNFIDYTRDLNQGKGMTFEEILEATRREWKLIDETVKVPFFPHMSVGWDANPRYPGFNPRMCKDSTPENFRKGLEMTKEYIDAHPELPAPLITINSWNEWTEGSYLEPDDLYGYGYLEAIKKVFLEGNKTE